MADLNINNLLNTVISDKKTKQKVNVQDAFAIDNVLNRYASYNYLFTLSAISETDYRDPKRYLGKKPKDVIARSSGILEELSQTTDGDTIKTEDQKSQSSFDGLNQREKGAIKRAQGILKENKDLYFETVSIDSVHGYNQERRLGTVTKIRMKLNEPSGITLLEKMKAAAFNNGWRDHIDASFLLTVEFKGFDELGKEMPLDNSVYKKVIPIKITRCQINVNQAGAIYDIEAVPFNEFGFMNRFTYLRSTITLEKAYGIRNFLFRLQNELNANTKQEADKGLFEKGKQDTYRITIDPKFGDIPLKVDGKGKNVNTVPMQDYQEPDFIGDVETLLPPPKVYKFGTKTGTIQPGTSIMKIIEEAMTSLQPIQDTVKNWFFKTVAAIREKKGRDLVGNDDLASLDESDYYIDWFKVKSEVVQDTGKLDNITKQHPKLIQYHVYPYKLHVFRLVQPGISLGGAKDVLVRKIYDYIFTGDNKNILDLDIDYKVAWFQTRLEPVSPNWKNSISSEQDAFSYKFGTETQIEDLLPIRSYPSGVKSAPAGIFSSDDKQKVDLFMDALTNPQADMVKVQLRIMGDPSWIGVTQYFPMKLSVTGSASVAVNLTPPEFQSTGQFNSKFQCYNVETADPIIRLNFKMPNDFDELKGTYNLSRTQTAVFSGLYQVYKVESNFDRGQFTQILHMTRFNNQGETRKTNYNEVKWYVAPDNRVFTAATTDTEGSF